jgi:tRNA nucleotidyltransferase (CCA-adding enzyme)
LWIHVTRHFASFLDEIKLDSTERADAEAKALRVAKSLSAAYYPDQIFDPACYAIVGSYAKDTAAKPRTDVDMIFVLPYWEFTRVDAVANNKHSYLLQEVKETLRGTYPNTDIRGDGPVVKVPFSTYEFEVCPVFRLQNNSFMNAHTKNGGRWGYTHPA